MNIPLNVFIEPEGESKSIGELRDAFFRRYRKKLIRMRSLQLNPLPPGFTAWDQHAIDFYFAIYRQGYYVRIERGATIKGPHKCQLMYQAGPGQHVLLGTHLGTFNFFDEVRIWEKMELYATKEKYFVSETTANQVINLPPSEQSEGFRI